MRASKRRLKGISGSCRHANDLDVDETRAASLAAEALGRQDRLGRLHPGYEADIIALDGDPLKDLTAVRRVVFVMRGGVIYKWTGAARESR